MARLARSSAIGIMASSHIPIGGAIRSIKGER
jgi:hypothetical protein